MSISYVNYKGKKIMVIDYTHCKTPQDTMDVLEQVKLEFLRTTGDVISMNDFTGVIPSNEYLDLAKSWGKEYFDARSVRTACIGITGIKKILLNMYNLTVKNKLVPFETKQEAFEYLVK
jgi:hypothetical protein